MSNELTLEEAQPEIVRAYWELLFTLVGLIANWSNGDREYHK